MTKDGYHTWQYQEKDLDVLKDPNVKAAFITNPSNPPSYGLTKALMNRIVEIVRNDNPNLMIITDDVYATFYSAFSLDDGRITKEIRYVSILSPNISGQPDGDWR